MRLGLLLLFVGLSCFGLGLYLGHGSRAELRAERDAAFSQARSESSPAPVVNMGSCAVSLDPEVLRSELAKALAHLPAVPSVATQVSAEPPTQEPPAPPTGAQIAAHDKANKVLDQAISTGSLNEATAQQLRTLMPSLDAESQQELRLRFVRAINEGKLHPAGPSEFF